MKHENKLVLLLLFASIASVCVGQIVFSGELKLGRVNTVGGSGGVYDPSTEFNTLTVPSGYATSNDDFTLSGSALVFSPSSEMTFISPTGDWQMDVKCTASGSSGTMGVVVGSWYFFADIASGPAFCVYGEAESWSATESITTAYFRVTCQDGALTFEHSTDGATYTELEPSEEESESPEIYTSTGALVSVYSGGDTEEFSFDYVRFTAL